MNDVDSTKGERFTAASVSYGNKTDQITLNVSDGIAEIVVIGEPDGKTVLACISFAVTSGIMRLPMPVLVDVTEFSGSIDWQSVQAVAAMTNLKMPEGPPSRVAYFAQSGLVSLVIKLLSYLFPKSQHRLFFKRDEALAWLRLSPVSPAGP